ncbi:MAG: hydrogenase maturation protease [Acidobacteriota bacterium]
MKPILILAMGNPSRGDDAFGPMLADRLTRWSSQQAPDIQNRIEVICDQQLMVEHVDDLQGRQRVLFIDAAACGDSAARLTPVEALPQPPTMQSHSCTPAQLLALYRHLLNAPPPRSHLLSVAGEGFELGAPLSLAIQQNIEPAWSLLMGWLNATQDRAHA